MLWKSAILILQFGCNGGTLTQVKKIFWPNLLIIKFEIHFIFNLHQTFKLQIYKKIKFILLVNLQKK